VTGLGSHALAWIAGIAIGSGATAAPRQLAGEVTPPPLAQAITAAAEREAAVASAAIDKNPQDVAARVRLARALLALERVDEAEGQLQEALRLAPGDEDVLYYLGLVTGHQARRTFERLFAIAPDSARVHQLMAESLEAREQRAEAEQEYASRRCSAWRACSASVWHATTR
jgi:tetratricopeptide (TPR) repeat protein